MTRPAIARVALHGLVAASLVALTGCRQQDAGSSSSSAGTPRQQADAGARHPGDGTAYVPQPSATSPREVGATAQRGDPAGVGGPDHEGDHLTAAIRDPESTEPTGGPAAAQGAPQLTDTPPASLPTDEGQPPPAFQPEDFTVAEDALLVDAAGLRRLDPEYNAWTDPAGKRVVLAGLIARREGPLEMFACLKGTKEHESIVAVHANAYLIHAALLALEAKPGSPVRFVDEQGRPKFQPAQGDEIEVTVLWQDEQGQRRQARGQEWIRDIKTGQALDAPWVFGGSGFWVNEATGERFYMAEDGDVICVSNFTTAMIDLPLQSSQAAAELMFEAFTERIPPQGSPVTVILTPRPGSRPSPVGVGQAHQSPLPAREDIHGQSREPPLPERADLPRP